MCGSALRDVLSVPEGSALPSMMLFHLREFSEAQDIGQKNLQPIYSCLMLFPLNISDASFGMENSYSMGVIDFGQ